MPKKPPIHRPRYALVGAAADREYNRTRRMANDPRNTARWRRLRDMKRSHDPLCEACKAEGVTRAMDQVDHIIPIEQRPDLAFVWENLQSLCTQHHARKSQEERRGRRGTMDVRSARRCAPLGHEHKEKRSG